MKKIGLVSFFIFRCIYVLFAQETTANGKIADNNALPVAIATIHLLNTNHWTTTDRDGSFVIKRVQPGKYILSVSAIGYTSTTKEIEIAQGSNELPPVQLVQSSTQLDAVVVSAEKKEQLVQKIPTSISVFPAKQVAEYRLWNINELSTIVPSLYAANPGDKRNVVSIRGITSTSYDPAVTTYIDGVNQFTLDTYIPQLFGVERIEVLRGPQGTLYGRNAMGGVINILTKQPTNHWDLFWDVTSGNYEQRYTAGFRVPIIKNKLFLGVAGLYEDLDGFYHNDYNNTTFDKQHSIAGNYFLKYLVNSNWTISLNAKHVANRNDGAFPLVIGSDEALAHPFVLNQNAIGKLVDNVFNTSLGIEHAGNGIGFSSQTSFQSNYRYYSTPIDGDFSPIDGITIINNYGKKWNNVKAITQEFKFSSPVATERKLKWTAGVYFFYHHAPNKQATHFGKDAPLLGSPDSNYAIINTTKTDNLGAALFGQATYPLNEKMEVVFGLRYDHQHSEQDVLGEYQPDNAPAPIFETRPDTSASVSYNALSPKLGLVFYLSNESNVYITYSRGYRTGGLTQLSLDPSQPPLYAYKPEYSNSFETGIKNTFLDNKLRANVALFYTIVSDAQVPTLVIPDAITVTRNAGSLKSKGIEIESVAIPFKGLEATYNFGYTDAKYSTLLLPQNGVPVNLSGNKQVFTPNITSMLALQYSSPLKMRLPFLKRLTPFGVIARGEWMYTGETFFDLANTIRQSPYHVVNGKFGIGNKSVEVFWWIRNWTDTRYLSYGYDFGAVHLGNPRTFGITLAMKGLAY